MARIKPRKGTAQAADAEPGGLWHQPALMNLLADLFVVLAVAALAWAGLLALQRLPVFPLRELALTQLPKQVSVDQVEHVARNVVIGNFFTVDLEATREAFEKMPWVRKAAVTRQWPDGLTLMLEEHEAVAQWRYPNGTVALVNAHGEVFAAERPDGGQSLPWLSGPEGSAPELLARHAEFGSVLKGIGRQATAVSLSPRRAWQLRLDDGVTVELGRDQTRHPLAEKMERFAAHYPGLRQRLGSVRVADMRYPGGFVLSGLDGGTRPAGPARKETAGRKS